MRIRVLSPTGLHNRKAGLAAWGPGEFEFTDGSEYRGWLDGQVARGAVEILADPGEVVPDDASVTEPPHANNGPFTGVDPPTAPEPAGEANNAHLPPDESQPNSVREERGAPPNPPATTRRGKP